MEGITKVEREIQETDVYLCTLSTTAACLEFVERMLSPHRC
jgi:hypothetical protein